MNNRQKKWLLKFRTWIGGRFLSLLSDLLVLAGSWLGAFWLRYNLEVPPEIHGPMFVSLAFAVGIQFAALLFFRIHRITARFVSMEDIFKIARMSAVGVFFTVAVLFAWNRLEGVPRSVPLIDLLLIIAGLGGTRLLYRMFRQGFIPRKTGRRTLIVGAGSAGEQFLRALKSADGEYNPVGFLDDSRGKAGNEIAGVRVLGRLRDLPVVAARYEVELAVLAIPSASRKLVRRFVEICTEAGVAYKTLPSTEDLLSGQAGVRAVRDVTIEDLLGREPVRLDWDLVGKEFSGKRVLVTGAGGSIGSELCRQLAKLSPESLILLENSEFALYSIEMELREQGSGDALLPVLCDIRDSRMVNRIFREQRPEIVFHAAAYKHVPMVERNPQAGIKTNVFGTCNLAQAAIESGVSKFVMISTDKAVNPANIMGCTKRIAEIYCQSLNRKSRDTVFVTTRFGNVLGSSGSVVPLFQRQIRAGGPVTVTDPEIERFFMTISEACQLVLQAAAMSKGGEIFVLDMGEPVKIAHLARHLIRLSGYEPGRDIDIVYTGLRPGEKLYEELFLESEELRETGHGKIKRSVSRPAAWSELQEKLKRLNRACKNGDLREIRRCISDMVPEYRPQESPDGHGSSGND